MIYSAVLRLPAWVKLLMIAFAKPTWFYGITEAGLLSSARRLNFQAHLCLPREFPRRSKKEPASRFCGESLLFQMRRLLLMIYCKKLVNALFFPYHCLMSRWP